MSGIGGVCNFDGRPVKSYTMEAMSKALAHRGPDGSGVWINGAVGFAHVMLWTTPESLTEKQPLLDTSGQLVISADARIDNRDDLIRSLDLNARADLSDSELILYAYSKWGEDCPEKLVGDFAFAIWDKRKRTLFAARDRIGIKPFYYHHKDGRGLVFASEISPIFVAADLQKRPDRAALEEYLTTSDLTHERTLFEGVRRLPPGSSMTSRGASVMVNKYWKPSSGQFVRKPNLDAHAEQFRELLTTAVKAQARSAYPIGCLLSGGLDSSSVLSLASRIVPDKRSLRAFSMTFDKLPCDERSFIHEIVQFTGVDWTPTVVDRTQLDGWETLADCYRTQREWPLQDLPSTITYGPLVNFAKERGVRVVLTGVGGDQVAQGSALYLADLLSSFRLRSLMQELKSYGFARRAVKNWMLNPLTPDWVWKTRAFLKFFIGRRNPNWYLSRDRWQTWQSGYKLPRRQFTSLSAWEQACWIADPILSLYLDGWWDPISSHGDVEFRHPFFDARLIEFMSSLPREEKISRGWTKIILRQGMRGYLPDSIRERTSKAEFSPLIGDLVANTRIDAANLCLGRDGFVDSRRVGELVGRQSEETNSPSWCQPLWRLARTEAWYGVNFNLEMEKCNAK